MRRDVPGQWLDEILSVWPILPTHENLELLIESAQRLLFWRNVTMNPAWWWCGQRYAGFTGCYAGSA